MVTLGIDIGTTSVSAVLYETDTRQFSSVTVANDAVLPSADASHRLQDPLILLERVYTVTADLLKGMVPDTTVVTGQMHGILYLDHTGKAVSPLYTWEDQSGACIRNESGQSYAAFLSEQTGMRISAGFGLCTHFVLSERGEIPHTAACFCTIPDFIAAAVSGTARPRMDASMAASLGGFDVGKGVFSDRLLELTEARKYCPQLSPTGTVMGVSERYGRVLCAVGDNQAGVYGAVGTSQGNICLNMGTGSQVSAVSAVYDEISPVEIRPYFEGKYLYVNASLNGGRAYARLRDFFRACMPGRDSDSLYQWMADHAEPETSLCVQPDLFGARDGRTAGGSIMGITGDNFTPGHLIAGFLDGMAEELIQMVQSLPEEVRRKAAGFTAAGNGLRKNTLLRKRLSARLGKALALLEYEEEAAYGAALLGANITLTRNL